MRKNTKSAVHLHNYFISYCVLGNIVHKTRITGMIESKTIKELYDMLRHSSEYLNLSDDEMLNLVMSRRPVELLIIASNVHFISPDNVS